MIFRILPVCLACLILAACAASVRPEQSVRSEAVETNFAGQTQSAAQPNPELNLTEARQAQMPQVVAGDSNNTGNDFNASVDISAEAESAEFYLTPGLLDENTSAALSLGLSTEGNLTDSDSEVTEPEQVQTPQVVGTDANNTNNDINASADITFGLESREVNRTSNSLAPNTSVFSNLGSQPEGNFTDSELTEPQQAPTPPVVDADGNNPSNDINVSVHITLSSESKEVNQTSNSPDQNTSISSDLDSQLEGNFTDSELTELQRSQTPQIFGADGNNTISDLNTSAYTAVNSDLGEVNLTSNSLDDNVSGSPYFGQAPKDNYFDNQAEPITPPQPLISEVEELQLQRGVVIEAEILVQSLGSESSDLELLQEDRFSDPEISPEDENTSDSAAIAVVAEPATLPDDAYQRQIASLLEAELAFRAGRYAESFALRMDVARASGDHRITREAYNSANFARDGEAMNQALDLWLEQAPNDQTAHRLRLTQLLQSYQPIRALRSLEQLYFLGAEVDFSLPVSILIYPTEDQTRMMLDAYSQMALQYEERTDIWSAMLLIRIYLANALYLQQRYGEAQAELQTIRSQQRGWELIPSETLHALDLQEARVNAEILSDQEIESWYERAISHSPDNWQLRLQHLALTPDPTSPARVLAVELISQADGVTLMALHSLARDLEINGTVATIEFYFRERARINNEQALQNLAEIAESYGQLVLADEYLSQLYSYPDIRLSAYLSRLHLWLSNDQPDIAHQIYRSAWQDRQLNQVEAGIVYARVLNEFQRYDQSLRLLTILLQQSDNQSQLLLLLVRAEVYMFRREYQLMEADLRRVIADAPEQSAAYNTLGYVLADINIRLDESERLIDQALQIDPENASYVDSLGWLAFRRGDLERARQLIEWAYSRWQYSDIIAHLGEIYWSLGEPERALYLWLDALENDDDNDLLISTIVRVTAADEGADLYQHLVARLQAITSDGER